MRISTGFLAALITLSSTLVAGMASEAATKKRHTVQSVSQKQSPSKPTRKKSLRKKRAKTPTHTARRKGKSKRTKVAGAPKRYLRWFSGIATAYVPIDTPMEGGRWTCTMRDGWATRGVAVDPRLIPLGSLLYIPGYGRALADDTGGRIKGRHVDVRLHSIRDMHRWGVKKVKIYVVRGPKRKKSRRLAA